MAIVHNKRYERQFVHMMCESGYHAERIADSGKGKYSVCDCILFKEGISYLVEVKATKFPVFVVNKYAREQFQKMIDVCSKNHIVPLLAIRFKNRGWKQIVLKEIPKKISFRGEK
ncbi:hypothetical protein ACFLZN_01610 [Nanoarchaeota archaeon]